MFCHGLLLSKTLGWGDLDCWCGYANIHSTVWAKVSLLSSSQQLLAPALSTGYWLCKSGWIMINGRSCILCIRLASISPHLPSSFLPPPKKKHLPNFTCFPLKMSKKSKSTHPPTHHPSPSINSGDGPLHKSVLLPFWCGRWAKCRSPSHPTNGPWRSRAPGARPRCTRHDARRPALPHPPWEAGFGLCSHLFWPKNWDAKFHKWCGKSKEK